MQKQKILNFGTKLPCLYFWAAILKNHCHIWNQRPRICLIAKFGGKIKILKFGTKNAWFGFFGAWIWKYYCYIWNQHPLICLIAKFHIKTKMPKFRIIGIEFQKTIVIFEIDTLEFGIRQKWVFNSYSEFSYRSAFTEGPGSTFSQGPCPFYKVCDLTEHKFNA